MPVKDILVNFKKNHNHCKSDKYALLNKNYINFCKINVQKLDKEYQMCIYLSCNSNTTQCHLNKITSFRIWAFSTMSRQPNT